MFSIVNSVKSRDIKITVYKWITLYINRAISCSLRFSSEGSSARTRRFSYVSEWELNTALSARSWICSMMNDPRSCERNLCNCSKPEKKKKQKTKPRTSMGPEPATPAVLRKLNLSSRKKSVFYLNSQPWGQRRKKKWFEVGNQYSVVCPQQFHLHHYLLGHRHCSIWSGRCAECAWDELPK